MVTHWEGDRLDELMKRMKVIIDTREQVNGHIIDYLNSIGVGFIRRKLEVGDYSAQIDDQTFEMSVAIERKASLDEIAGNMTKERERFEKEFYRAKANRTKVFLIIEDELKNLYRGNYRSQYQPKAFRASIKAWQTRFNVTVTFCGKEYSPQEIYETLYYAVREELLNGKQ